MKIGFLGCGKIAEPMIRSIIRRFPETQIFVSHRSIEISSRLTGEFENLYSGENQWVLDHSDTVVLSVLANVARDAFPKLKFSPHHQIISVMADISLSEVSTLIAPAIHPCVTIPIPFIEAGGCPLPVFPDPALLDTWFGDENQIITLSSEDHTGPHFAATAILSTLMAQLNCVGNWLGNKSGNKENGEIYVSSLVAGYLNNIKKDEKNRFLEVLQDLSTEGGLNTQLLKHDLDAGMIDTLKLGLDALDERLRNDGSL